MAQNDLELIAFLKKFVAMQSVSSDPAQASESLKTAEFLASTLQELGVETQLVCEMEGKNSLVLGKLGNDPDKPTLALYGHYDVQPASKDDGWDTEPFELTEKEGYLFGRGASDDKGPISATIYALKELQQNGGFPCNFRFIYEGEEESSSGGFEEAILAHKDYIGPCDGLLVMDTGWFTDSRPSMTYGLRGMAYMGVEISGPAKDLHSGLAGGVIREPMTDLIEILSQLIENDTKAKIDGFYDDVRPVSEEELQLYEDLEFDVESFRKDVMGSPEVIGEGKTAILMNTWRHPSISLHGIEGAFSGPGGKTVVPAKVIGKVSMRLVPDQDPIKIAELFKKQIEKLFSQIKTPNSLMVETIGTGDWWYGDPQNYLFQAGTKAMSEYWGMVPAYDRVGGSIPIVPFMEKVLNAPAMLLGIGQPSDGAHSQNERIRIKNLIGGREVLIRLFNELGKKS